MSDADRDLVSAIRTELASIVPQRACDRLAESVGLGTGLAPREAAVARLAVRLGGRNRLVYFDDADGVKSVRGRYRGESVDLRR